MANFAGISATGFACHSFSSLLSISAGINRKSSRSCGRRIGWSLPSRDLQPGGLWVPAPFSSHGMNLIPGCWRGFYCRALSGNGRKNKGGDGQSSGLGKKDDRKKKDNVWSSDTSSSNQSKGVPGKKNQTNVWSSGSSGKPSQIRSKSKESEGHKAGQPLVSPRRSNVVVQDESEGSLDHLESSGAKPKEKRKKDKQDVDDLTFLRFLSPVLPIEDISVLQTEEPVPNPAWHTFCGNASGVWSGVGAAFSPITGEFEPLSMDENKTYLYDARILGTVKTFRTSEDGTVLPQDKQGLQRKVFWSLEKTQGKQGEGMVMVQDDDEEDEESISSFLTPDDAYDEVDELGDWEEGEDTEGDGEEDSEWEYFLGDPGEIDEKWEVLGVEDSKVMEELEKDTDPVQEDDTGWTSMWGRREVLDGDWEGRGLLAGENESGLIGEQKMSSRLYSGDSPTLATSVETSDGAGLTDALGTTWTELMEEDHMDWEPGLVFFEHGAYSRGPLKLLTEASTSGREYFNTYTCKIEQCLVADGHRRLRIVHTVSVDKEGEEVEVLRVAAYEEEWMGPSNLKLSSEVHGQKLKLFSERPRHTAEDLVGTWKAFEIEALAIHPPNTSLEEKASFVFSCKESSFKRRLPVHPKLTIQEGEQSIDVTDFSVLWLTGRVSTYVVASESGVLTFGVGWVCDDGPRLVMERVYGEDGHLLHVNSKSEIKGAG